MPDSNKLQRFINAQNPLYDDVLAELRQGLKESHWMWFIFPQIKGLGGSAMAVTYAISSIDEAKAYLQHPVLGPRLRECTGLVNRVDGRQIGEILGYPDDLKFHSSMTLFAEAALDNDLFTKALNKYFGGKLDRLTLEKLSNS
jgi:uncharacterized protein (DUF1810 family)